MECITNIAVVVCLLLNSFDAGTIRLQDQKEYEVIDMTHTFDETTVYWPIGPDRFNLTILIREQLENFWYETNTYAGPEHGGTHLDAPAHYAKGVWRTDDIPLENMIGPAVVVNVSEKAAINPDYQLEISDIEEWELEHGEIPSGAILCMHNNWHPRWPNKTLVFNSTDARDPTTFHFPGLKPETATWIVDNRSQVIAFATDTPSIDYGQSRTMGTHVVLLSNNKPAFENVANMHLLPAYGAMIYAIPMKIGDGSGGPLRIFATVAKDGASVGTQLGVKSLWIGAVFHVIYIVTNIFWM